MDQELAIVVAGAAASIVPITGLAQAYHKQTTTLNEKIGPYLLFVKKTPPIYALTTTIIFIALKYGMDIPAEATTSIEFFALLGAVCGVFFAFYGKVYGVPEVVMGLQNDSILFSIIPFLYSIVFVFLVRPIYLVLINEADKHIFRYTIGMVSAIVPIGAFAFKYYKITELEESFVPFRQYLLLPFFYGVTHLVVMEAVDLMDFNNSLIVSTVAGVMVGLIYAILGFVTDTPNHVWNLANDGKYIFFVLPAMWMSIYAIVSYIYLMTF